MPASKSASSAAFKGAFLRNAGKYQGKPCCVSAGVGQASVLPQVWPTGGAGQSLIRCVTLLSVLTGTLPERCFSIPSQCKAGFPMSAGWGRAMELWALCPVSFQV